MTAPSVVARLSSQLLKVHMCSLHMSFFLAFDFSVNHTVWLVIQYLYPTFVEQKEVQISVSPILQSTNKSINYKLLVGVKVCATCCFFYYKVDSERNSCVTPLSW